MAGNFYGGTFFNGGFFGASVPSAPTPSTHGGGGGTVDWQTPRRRPRRSRHQELFDALAQTLHELVSPSVVGPDLPMVVMATAQAAHATLQRLDAFATTSALQRDVEGFRRAITAYLQRQKDLLAEEEDELWLLL